MPRPAFWLVVTRPNGVVEIRLNGSFDVPASARLSEIVTTLADREGALGVVVDLSNLSPVDPAAVAVLAKMAADMKRRGAALTVTRPPPVLMPALNAAGVAIDVTSSVGPPRRLAHTTGAATSRSRHPAGRDLIPPEPKTGVWPVGAQCRRHDDP